MAIENKEFELNMVIYLDNRMNDVNKYVLPLYFSIGRFSTKFTDCVSEKE